jgi:hypothetical protein
MAARRKSHLRAALVPGGGETDDVAAGCPLAAGLIATGATRFFFDFTRGTVTGISSENQKKEAGQFQLSGP